MDNPPAFPPHSDAFDYVGVQTGMSLRDWFAGQALIGLSGNQDWLSNVHRAKLDLNETSAKAAYEFADAMLLARSPVSDNGEG